MALLDALDSLLSKSAITVLAIGVALFIIGRRLEQPIDKLEPPAIKSRVPYFGLLFRTLREKQYFLSNLE